MLSILAIPAGLIRSGSSYSFIADLLEVLFSLRSQDPLTLPSFFNESGTKQEGLNYIRDRAAWNP
jgi:hypothetical protein